MSEWSSTQDTVQLRSLEARIKAFGRNDLRKAMRRRIRVAARPVVSDLRQAALGVAVTSSKGGAAHPDTSTDLRARVARAVTVSATRKGVRIRVPAGKVGSHGASLPKYLDADLPRFKRWRHPVFGRVEHAWVEQRGEPWFFVTIRRHYPGFRRGIVAAMDDAARNW